MKKFIVPLDITVHFSCEVEAENKVEALQMAIDKVEFEDIDWNSFSHHICPVYDIKEQEDTTMEVFMLGPNHPVRYMTHPDGSGTITVGTESVNGENSEYDSKYYCYVPDDIFWNVNDADLQDFINKNFD